MMKRTFLVSDTHFGHAGVCRFTHKDTNVKIRPWTDPDEMDKAMVELWNDTVRPNDKVYHLGDVVINRKSLPILEKLNGDKILIRGNHDIFKLKDYTKYFRDIRGYHVMANVIFSHIPVHPESKGRFRGNIHGHLHTNKLDDPWYQCVCVEQTEFKPILVDEVLERFDSHNNLTEA